MKKTFIAALFLLFSFAIATAQNPEIQYVRVFPDGSTEIHWSNAAGCTAGQLWYRSDNIGFFSVVNNFTGDTTFLHADAHADTRRTWYYLSNTTAEGTIISDTVETYFLTTEVFDDAVVRVRWNPFRAGDERALLLTRHLPDLPDTSFLVTAHELLDSVMGCTTDCTYDLWLAPDTCLSNTAVTEANIEQPVAPILDSLTITDDLHPTLWWQRSPSLDCCGYQIFRQTETDREWVRVATINHPDSLHATDLSFDETCILERTYCVVAVDYCGNTSPLNTAQSLHNVVLEPPVLDTCEGNIHLEWYPFEMTDIAPQVGGYRIWYSQDGGPFQLDGTAPPNVSSYDFTHPERHSHYRFKLQAINNLETKSVSSCEHQIFADLPLSPAFGWIRYATVRDSYVHLCFEVDTQASAPTYQLFRSMSGNEGTFELWQTLEPTGSPLLYTVDSIVDVNLYRYHYQLVTLDSCQHRLEAPLTVQNILLRTTSNTQSQVQLDWTPYEGFLDGTITYLVYRRVGDSTFTLFAETSSTSLTDDSDEAQQLQHDLTYHVAAVSGGTTPDTVWSNISLYAMQSFTVYFPNAFRPAGEHNRIFRPIFTGIAVSELQFIIYNRWGEPIFSTTQQGEGWNGKDAKGKDCEAGTYVYYFLMTDKEGNHYQHSGFVVVLR